MDNPHIKLISTDDHPALVVDDWELFDYIDDFLTERGIKYDHFVESQQGDRETFTMFFETNVTSDSLSLALTQIPSDEIERIWHLNNQ